MAGKRSPNTTTAAPISVRLLWALSMAERLAPAGAAHAVWALHEAADQHGVDRLALAELWLTKLTAARAAAAKVLPDDWEGHQ